MVANGLLAADLLVPVNGQPQGTRLRADAAASWARLSGDIAARFGWRPQVTSAADAYRAYAVQERIFRERYTPAGPTVVDHVGKFWAADGRRWYRRPIYAAAATPGTSNHGWGLACDITALGGFNGARYRQLASVAAAHGWDNNEGRSINEAWHWVYKPTADRVSNTITAPGRVDINTPTGRLPDPLEDDMSAQAEQQIADLHAALLGTGPVGLPHLHNKVDRLPEATGENVWRRERISRAFPDGRATTTPLQDLADAASRSTETAAHVGALTAALTAVASAKGLDPAAVTAAAREGAVQALEAARFTVATKTGA